MSVKLRLRRGGRKKRPFYRIVAVDSRKRRDGAYLERIGFYNPLEEPAVIEIDREKALKWLDRGAIPSDTVRSFLKRKGILLEWELRKRGYSADRIEEELKRWEVLQLERLKKLEAKAAMEKRKPQQEEAETEEAAESAETQTAEEEAPVAAEEAKVEEEAKAEETAPAEEASTVEEEKEKTDESS